MRIGIVCPYSMDTPGGVQFHVRDLAEYFIGAGHHVSVLAPADDDQPLPPYVVSCGRALPVRYNGSVARLTFGPLSAARTGRWLEQGDFDVLHLHEPITPSASVLALWASDGPTVATFHTANIRSRAMQVAYPLFRPSLEKIGGRIAVSEDARRTVTTHFGGDAVVIPNGVYVERFSSAPVTPEWVGTTERPTVAFLGRMQEPRKGLPVLAEALPALLEQIPGLRVLIAGPGDPAEVTAGMSRASIQACEFLGPVSDEEKASLLHTADVYLAPNTGGESFGIILIEALSAGAAVLASDIPAFVRVLDGGACGATFVNEDADDLARELVALLRDPQRREALAEIGRRRARIFDWSEVADDIMAVYETVIAGAHASGKPTAVRAAPDAPSGWSRFLRSGRGGEA